MIWFDTLDHTKRFEVTDPPRLLRLGMVSDYDPRGRKVIVFVLNLIHSDRNEFKFTNCIVKSSLGSFVRSWHLQNVIVVFSDFGWSYLSFVTESIHNHKTYFQRERKLNVSPTLFIPGIDSTYTLQSVIIHWGQFQNAGLRNCYIPGQKRRLVLVPSYSYSIELIRICNIRTLHLFHLDRGWMVSFQWRSRK